MIKVIGKTSWVGQNDLAAINRRAQDDGMPPLDVGQGGDFFANIASAWNMPMDEAVAYANLALSAARDAAARQRRNIGEALMTPMEVRTEIVSRIVYRDGNPFFAPGDLIRRLKIARVAAHTVYEAMTLRELAWAMNAQAWLEAAHPALTSEEALLSEESTLQAEALWITAREIETPSLR